MRTRTSTDFYFPDRWFPAETISGSDIPTPEDFIPGCGDGVMDATTAVQALATQGGLARFPRGGVYKITAPIVAAAPIQWWFDGGSVLDTSALAQSSTALTISGSQGTGILLTTDGERGGFSFTVASAAGLAAGQSFRLASDAIWDIGRLNMKLGESNTIAGISGNVLTVLEPLEFDWLVADNATLFPWTMWEDVVLENYRAVGRLDDSLAKGRVGVLMKYLRKPQVYGMESFRYGFGHLALTDCISPRVDSIRTENDSANVLGYGITISNTTKGGVITAHSAVGMGHALSYGGGSPVSQAAAGLQRDNIYRDFDIAGGNLNSTGGGRDSIDAHSTVIRGRIEGGTIRANDGGGQAGINLEGGSWEVRGVKVIGVTGSALQYSLFNNYDATLAVDMEADGCTDVVNITESYTDAPLGRLTHTDINIRSARNFTGQLVDWDSLHPVPAGAVNIRFGSIDAAASTDVIGLVFLANPLKVGINGGVVRNRVSNGGLVRVDSINTVSCSGSDWGTVEFAASPNSSASLVQFRSRDICRNGTFPDEDWMKGTGWAIHPGGINLGYAEKTAGSASNLSQSDALIRPFVAGRDYLVNIHITARTAGTVTPKFTGGTTVTGTALSALGVQGQTMIAATGNNTFVLAASADFAGTIESILCYEDGTSNIIGGYQFPDEYWVKGAGWSITSNTATHAPGSASDLTQATPYLRAGTSYVVSYVVSGRTAGSVTFKLTGGTTVTGTTTSSNTTTTETLVALSGNNALVMSATADFDGTIDDMTVKPVIIIKGDPISVEARCTTTNTAKDFLLFDACTQLTPVGRKRGNALTPVSTLSGSTFTAREQAVRLAANGNLMIPANHYIEEIYIHNLAANAVTGGIRIGTTNGGTQVVAAQAVAASAFLRIAAADILTKSWTANQNLFIQAVTAWNSADLRIIFKLGSSTDG